VLRKLKESNQMLGHTLFGLLSLLLHVVVHRVAAEPTLARQSHVDIKMAVRLLHAEVIHSLQTARGVT